MSSVRPVPALRRDRRALVPACCMPGGVSEAPKTFYGIWPHCPAPAMGRRNLQGVFPSTRPGFYAQYVAAQAGLLRGMGYMILMICTGRMVRPPSSPPSLSSAGGSMMQHRWGFCGGGSLSLSKTWEMSCPMSQRSTEAFERWWQYGAAQ